MYLSEHFTLEELTFSQTAARRRIQNEPNITQVARLRQLCLQILEPVRARLNHNPITISSGFRGEILNKAIGGSASSQHMTGDAADFTIPAFGTVREVVELIAISEIDFDQLIYEGNWIHISNSKQPRRRVLTAQFTADGIIYRAGIV